jgi:hypothetical protein
MNRSGPITLLATAAAILLIAVGVASCSGRSDSNSSSNSPAAAPAAAPSSGIPQGDVGDNDSDNHGGPDDGDGDL